MLQALNLNPGDTQKRLGDGFYEQKLIREQVALLTGQRFLGDYASDEAQYMALMTNGLTTAKALQLRPGVALSAEQMAQLTSDIVWLVEQTVTLADGSTQKVLTPQVYVRVKEGDLDGTGALIGGKDVDLKLAGDLTNSGTIAGRNVMEINAKNSANLGKAVVNNLANAGVTSALTGTSLEDNIKTGLVSAFISAGAGSAAFEIGNQTQDSQVLKALAHALAGCMAGGASGGKQGCESGAIGAVVGELAAQWYDPNGTKPPQDTLDFVKVISAAAGAITGDGSAASVSTAVMTGVNAAMNNRLMHFDEKERIRIAAGGDADKQERLTKAACFEIKCWAQFPEGSDLYKTNYVSVAEMSGLQAEWDWVKAQKDFGAFNYTPSQKFTDWVASNTGLASGTLNGKVLGAATNKACANGDTSCLTGIGQQQNPALTEDEKKARAEYFDNLGEEYQRSANLAASMRLPQVALSYEIAAGVTALLEQAYQPSLGKVVVDTLLVDEAVSLIAKESGVPLLYVQEIADKMIKPKLDSLRQWLDGVGK